MFSAKPDNGLYLLIHFFKFRIENNTKWISLQLAALWYSADVIAVDSTGFFAGDDSRYPVGMKIQIYNVGIIKNPQQRLRIKN